MAPMYNNICDEKEPHKTCKDSIQGSVYLSSYAGLCQFLRKTYLTVAF